MCLYPRIIKNRKYIPNKKNGGIIPIPIDNRAMGVPVGCGKCIECMKQKAMNWRVRLHEELRLNEIMLFVTLTFSDEELTKLENDYKELKAVTVNNTATISVRRFLERWRKKYGNSVKHWLVTELGEDNGRIHLHGILWTNKSKIEITELWKYGFVWIGDYVNEKTINYIVKYLHKPNPNFKEYTPIVLCSKGIGSNYLNRLDSKLNTFDFDKTKDYYKTRTGIKLSLPIYYRNKIYDDDEREILWMQRLDKNIRYVDGQKIDISKGMDAYWDLLEKARIKNKQIGFEERKWNKNKYEDDLNTFIK